MKSTFGKAAVAATVLGAAGAASAFTLTGDAGVARSFQTLEHKLKGLNDVKMKSLDYRLGVAVQLVNEIPVSVGINAKLVTFNKKDTSNAMSYSKDAETAYGYEFSPEVKAWAPAELLGPVADIVSPYVKAGYTFEALSSYTFEGKNDQNQKFKSTGKTQGFSLGVGTAVNITENISALVDYTYSDAYLQTKPKGGEKGDKDYLTTHSFMIGGRISV